MEIQLPDALSYRAPLWNSEVRETVFIPLLQGGLTPGFVKPLGFLDPKKPLIITSLDLYTPELESWLRNFCAAGGQVFLYPGAGERNIHGAQGDSPPPGYYSSLVGSKLADYVPLDLYSGQTFNHQAGIATADNPMECSNISIKLNEIALSMDIRHSEILNPNTAKVLATYTEGIAKGKPAITQNSIGKGSLTYLGAIPACSSSAFILWKTLLPDLMEEKNDYQCWHFNSDAGKFNFLFNSDCNEVVLKKPMKDCITDKTVNIIPPYGVILCRYC